MQELGLSKADIDNLSLQNVYEYIIILSEMHKISKEKTDAHKL